MGNNGFGMETPFPICSQSYSWATPGLLPLPERERGGQEGGKEAGGEHSSEEAPALRSRKSLDQIFLVTLRIIFMISETGLIVYWKMGGLVLKTR